MTKRQKKAALEYRRKHPEQYVAYSAAWKARNPDWWKGRKMVQLLTSALINGNAKSKVFKDAGITMSEWTARWPCPTTLLSYELSNGSRLAPIKSWREFDRKAPDRVKQFLAPGNFRLVSK